MNKQAEELVEKLVEKVAGKITVACGYDTEYPCPYAVPVDICPHEDKDICQWQLDQAREILSCDPDLALIERDWRNKTAVMHPVIPLAEALKEVTDGK